MPRKRGASSKAKPKPERSGLNGLVTAAENVTLAVSLLEVGASMLEKRNARNAERAEGLAREAAERQLCELHLADFPVPARTIIPPPELGLRGRLTREGKEQHQEAVCAHAALQSAQDGEWQLLTGHDPAYVIDTVNEAFVDNAAPSICIDAGEDEGRRYVSLVVTAPHPDVVLRKVWKNGKSPVMRSDRDVAAVYSRMISSIVLATVKEALVSAPSADEARIVVVRWETQGLLRRARLGAIYSATFERSVLKTDWSKAIPRRLIGRPSDARIDAPDGKPWRALPLRKHPDLEILLREIEGALVSTPEPGAPRVPPASSIIGSGS